MAAPDLAEGVAEGVEEEVVRVADGAVEVELDDRLGVVDGFCEAPLSGGHTEKRAEHGGSELEVNVV